MMDELPVNDACHLCQTRREQTFCRIYGEDRRMTLCSPACANTFLLGPLASDRKGRHATFVEAYVEAWRWRELGQ